MERNKELLDTKFGTSDLIDLSMRNMKVLKYRNLYNAIQVGMKLLPPDPSLYVYGDSIPTPIILEYGCGTGTFLRSLGRDMKCTRVGIDHNKESISTAQRFDPEGIYTCDDKLSDDCPHFTIFIDILEHFLLPDSLDILCKALDNSKYVYAHIPFEANSISFDRETTRAKDHYTGHCLHVTKEVYFQELRKRVPNLKVHFLRNTYLPIGAYRDALKYRHMWKRDTDISKIENYYGPQMLEKIVDSKLKLKFLKTLDYLAYWESRLLGKFIPGMGVDILLSQ